MLLFLLRILLVWWLLTVVIKWLSVSAKRPDAVSPDNRAADPGDLSDIPISGDIEDADFEEIDER